MIKSASQYPVHSLLSYETNTVYRVPPYQREYSWQKAQWEDLFDDLVEADGPHFLGTIITLNSTVDAVEATVLELIDGQQRMTTLTLLMAAVYSVLKEHVADLDEDAQTDLTNLRRMLVRRSDKTPRLSPQLQGHNRADYRTVLADAGLPVEADFKNYMALRRVHRCYHHFRSEILEFSEGEGLSPAEAALRVLAAVQRAIMVKIEVASAADAFVLFESLNNRGMPLTPVDLIKNHLLAEAERRGVMTVDDAFKRWNEMLTNLGDNYSNQERFLRHYYNAFKDELPDVPKAPVATRASLIRIYEALLSHDITRLVDRVVSASATYGRITGNTSGGSKLDASLQRLMRAQGAPSHLLMLWLLEKREELQLSETDLIDVSDLLTNFFVRRNLTGLPQTHMLTRLFIDIVKRTSETSGSAIAELIRTQLSAVSVDDQQFRERLLGPIYEDNSDVARFILTTLAEAVMTKENSQNLWLREKGHYVWTIEHILPQGANLPQAWIEMLGGTDSAREVQSKHVHRLGNLTITGYNSTLGNKSFAEKKERKDSKGRFIGYRNGLSLNADVVTHTQWTAAEIETRTQALADQVVKRFPL